KTPRPATHGGSIKQTGGPKPATHGGSLNQFSPFPPPPIAHRLRFLFRQKSPIIPHLFANMHLSERHAMRKPFVAGNWKMNLHATEALALAQAIAAKASQFGNTEVGIIPPFVYIPQVKWVLKDAPIGLGAQDVYFEKNGAFT